MRWFAVLVLILVCTGAYADSPQTDIGKEVVSVVKELKGVAEDVYQSELGSLARFALWWKLVFKPMFNVVVGLIFLTLGNLVVFKIAKRSLAKIDPHSEGTVLVWVMAGVVCAFNTIFSLVALFSL